MSEPSTAARDAGRCPRCRARVVAGQEWCSLCLEPLGAGPADPALADPALPDPSLPGVTEGALDDATPGAPATRPRARGELPPGLAEAMLAELAAASEADRPLARGPLAGKGRGARLLLGCGAAVLLGAVLLLLLTLVGQLL